jgi:hypothetical protein
LPPTADGAERTVGQWQCVAAVPLVRATLTCRKDMPGSGKAFKPRARLDQKA